MATYATTVCTRIHGQPRSVAARFHWIMASTLAAMVALGAALEPSLALKHYRLFGCLIPCMMAVWCFQWLEYKRVAELMSSLAWVCGSWIAMVPLLAAAAHNSA